MHCQLGGGEVDGPQRAAALKRTFEYKLCHVTLVFGVDEIRNSKSYDYLVLLFSDGSYLCQCRTLQVLGLGRRHFWAAMLHNPKFRFHVGLLFEHWLTEKVRGTPEKDGPSSAAPKWIVADRHAGAARTTEVLERGVGDRSRRRVEDFRREPDSPNGPLDLNKRPTVQDRTFCMPPFRRGSDKRQVFSPLVYSLQWRWLSQNRFKSVDKLRLAMGWGGRRGDLCPQG